MPRLSKTQKFENMLKDVYGRHASTTMKGELGYQTVPGIYNPYTLNQMTQAGFAAALRPDFTTRFEIPTRDHAIAYIAQEMLAVCSKLNRALDKLASDATQDSTAASQPFTIIVDEENTSRRQKILAAAQDIVTRTQIGRKGRMRLFRALKTGDAIGQPIYALVGGKFRLVDVVLMPSWEMHFNPKTRTWKQFRATHPTGKPIAEWDIPDFMARTIHDEDDNWPYGKSILSSQVVNYRQYIMSLEDLAVAARTRAPRRLVHLIGPEGGAVRIDDNAIEAYKSRNESKPKSIITDYYISRGFEEIKELTGDASGLLALIKLVDYNEDRMVKDLGLQGEYDDLRGRSAEQADIAYAQRINFLRQEDSPFVLDVIKKGLLLEGYDDVGIDISIPPLAETESVRWKRYSDAYHNSLISYDTWCAGVGLKDSLSERERIANDIQWKEEHGIPVFTLGSGPNDGNSTDGQGGGVGISPEGVRSESSKAGVDTNHGIERRREIRRQGRVPTGA